MDYEILSQLQDESDSRLQDFCQKNNVYVDSKLEEVTEPFNGANPYTRLFVYKNYMSRTGLMNLAIVIRETPRDNVDTSSDVLQVEADVETSIFPLYLAKQDAFELPDPEPTPNLHPDEVRFILEKRKRPRVQVQKGEIFDPNIHRWNVNMIAEQLHISNRIVSQFCRSKNV